MNHHTRIVPNGRRVQTWSQSEASTAAAIWDREIADHFDVGKAPAHRVKQAVQAIADALDRSYENVVIRYQHYGPGFGAMRERGSIVAASAAAERDRRREASFRQDLTASVFGDPPPGFSALDQRRQAGR